MSDPVFEFSPPPVVALPIAGRATRFPLRRIYCVGRNYLEHVRELGNDEAAPPIFFTKPRDAIVQDGGTISYPSATQDFHFELELAVAMRSGGHDIDAGHALTHVFGYAVALDMTRRDLQKALIAKAAPWDLSKGFDQSCPCGPIHPADEVGRLEAGRIHLGVNGKTRQDSDLALMIWKVPQIIANLSRFVSLQAGDLILTGTPHGVGPVVPGDVMVGAIEGLGTLTITVGPSAV